MFDVNGEFFDGMDSRFQTTFVPKKPITPSTLQSGGPPRRAIAANGIIPTIAGLLVVLTLASAIGVFLYGQFLTRRLVSMSKSLEAVRESIDSPLIAQLKRVDRRIETAKEVLDRHTKQSPLFSVLEASTLRNIMFENFKYTTESANGASLTMSGKARGFDTIALQADLLSESADILSPVFSDFARPEGELVSFMFSANINPQLLAYRVADGVSDERMFDEVETTPEEAAFENEPIEAESATTTPQ